MTQFASKGSSSQRPTFKLKSTDVDSDTKNGKDGKNGNEGNQGVQEYELTIDEYARNLVLHKIFLA